jgi:hypothetical protein
VHKRGRLCEQLVAGLQGGQDRLVFIDGGLSNVTHDDSPPYAGAGGAPGESVDESGQRRVPGRRDYQPVEGDIQPQEFLGVARVRPHPVHNRGHLRELLRGNAQRRHSGRRRLKKPTYLHHLQQ